MFVVAGVTGHTGAVVADTLLAKGLPVRVLVRTEDKGAVWKKKGAEVAVVDLSDVPGLTRALTGATAAYLLTPPNFAVQNFVEDRRLLVDGMAKAVQAARLERLVFLSSVAAHQPSGTGPIVTVRHAEQALQKAAPSVTFIRAAYFLENWGSVIPLVKNDGVLPHFGAIDVKFSQVSTKDIGLAAARALVEPSTGVRHVELAGAEDWSVQDLAKAFSQLVGKPVTAIAAPVEGAKAGLMQAGVPETMAGLYAEMYAGAAKGLLTFEKPNTVVRGNTPLAETLRGLL